jgi:hypothetical protein
MKPPLLFSVTIYVCFKECQEGGVLTLYVTNLAKI